MKFYTKEGSFAEVSENLVRCRFKNNYVRLPK